MNINNDKFLYSLDEAYKAIASSPAGLRRMIHSGEIASIKKGRRRFIARAELQRYTDQLRHGARAQGDA